MKQDQINRAEMLAATRAYLDANTDVWAPIPIISNFKSKLDELINQIVNHQEAKVASQVFLGSNKTDIKKKVAEKADILNDVLAAYASVEDNAPLEQKSNKSFSDLFRLRNQEFNAVIVETIQLLEDNVEAMTDYGITPYQIQDLKNIFDDFLAISGKPRQYKIASSQATQALEELFSEANVLLDKKLDRVMKRFKNSNSNFYKGYLSARVIVD